MKNLFKTLVAVAIVSVTVQSCKKGDDDPGLSLSSRKSRFAGEWKVSNADINTTRVNNDNDNPATVTTTTSKTTISASTITINNDNSSTSGTNSKVANTGTVSEFTYTIEKDGTWTSKMVRKITSATFTNSLGTTTTAQDVTTTVESNGTWQFLGSNKNLELKNKEAVALSTSKSTTKTVDVSTVAGGGTTTSESTETYAPNEMVEVWTLSQLAKKEMVGNIEYDNSSAGSITQPVGGSSLTSKYSTITEKGTAVITFTQE